MDKIKPKVVVSKCIEFEYCRYNANIISSDLVKLMKDYVEFLPVCAEVEIGLGVPRDPIRVVGTDDDMRLMQSSTGKDYTKQMTEFANSFLTSLEAIDGFILKSSSPSCGIKHTKHLAGIEKGSPKIGKGPGFFGRAVMQHYPNKAIETDGRLRNFRIREHYLTKLYTLTRFREMKEQGKMKDLVNFQSHNKFLFMAYEQNEMRLMGRVAANIDHLPADEVFSKYEKILNQMMKYPPKFTSNINVLMHMLGYFKDELTPEEKSFFLDELEKYRAGWIPLFVLTSLLQSWVVRFDQDYLRNQTFFEPYPEELMTFDIKDTWRGRSYWKK